MRQCLTAVVERNVTWHGEFATEPWESAWASEAIFFVRVLSIEGVPPSAGSMLAARVEISPDGTHWCDEGGDLEMGADAQMAAVRARHFGGWLRLAGQLAPGISLRVVTYLNLKE